MLLALARANIAPANSATPGYRLVPPHPPLSHGKTACPGELARGAHVWGRERSCEGACDLTTTRTHSGSFLVAMPMTATAFAAAFSIVTFVGRRLLQNSKVDKQLMHTKLDNKWRKSGPKEVFNIDQFISSNCWPDVQKSPVGKGLGSGG